MAAPPATGAASQRECLRRVAAGSAQDDCTCSHRFSPTLRPKQERTAPLSSTNRGLCRSGRVAAFCLAGLLLLSLVLSLAAWFIDSAASAARPAPDSAQAANSSPLILTNVCNQFDCVTVQQNVPASSGACTVIKPQRTLIDYYRLIRTLGKDHTHRHYDPCCLINSAVSKVCMCPAEGTESAACCCPARGPSHSASVAETGSQLRGPRHL